jgi:hypothetical protein
MKLRDLFAPPRIWDYLHGIVNGEILKETAHCVRARNVLVLMMKIAVLVDSSVGHK